ncbi:MAG: 3'(2'),5'-bisphosphate nucleotidase CysQ [Methyloligellaceae bacterium]
MAGRENARLAECLLQPIQRAGRVIMEHYERGTCYTLKADASPVTAADHDSEKIILEALAKVAPGLPVISEESVPDAPVRCPGSRFVLVDPLDGTKEFINKQSDFTVNVAVIENGTPCFGAVYAPASAELYYTPVADRAVRVRLDPFGPDAVVSDLTGEGVRTRTPGTSGLTAVASRSHLNEATSRYLEELGVTDIARAGSSLKFCRIAEGSADVYPRLSPTMEWDTAAGHAVLAAAGGTVVDLDGVALSYGHTERNFTNPGFVAWGRAP